MIKNILSVCVCLMLVGCASATPIQYQKHMKLHAGMSKQEVLTTMGPPAYFEKYKKYNDVIIEFLIYRHFVSYEDQTPIGFINNKLVGWGQTFYQDRMSDDDKRLK